MEMFELADALDGLKKRQAELKNEIKEVNERIDDVTEKLTKQMVNNELQNFQRNGKTFYLTTQINVSDIATLRNDLYKALRDSGYGDIIKETVHPQTLAAFVKEQMKENGDELPEWLRGLVNVYQADVVRMRKSS